MMYGQQDVIDSVQTARCVKLFRAVVHLVEEDLIRIADQRLPFSLGITRDIGSYLEEIEDWVKSEDFDTVCDLACLNQSVARKKTMKLLEKAYESFFV